MKEIREEEFIDLKKILARLLSKWYYFTLSLVLCLGIALLYLKMAPKQYEVQATVLLKDQSLSDKGVGQEKFINGLELLSGNPDLADEIGVLSSYSMVQRALERLDYIVSYFQYPDSWGFLGRRMEEELYQTQGFNIVPDYQQPQLIGVPIYISFPDTQHYRIQAEANEALLYNLQEQRVIQEKVTVLLDDTLLLDQPYHSSLLSFQLTLDSGFVVQEDQRFYVMLNTLEGLTETYAEKLEITPISDESSIVQLKVQGRVLQKEKDFLNTLVSAYIQHDLNKKNQLGLRAIEFIDSQLATVYDSLQSVEGNLESFRASNQIINISTTSENLNEQLQELEAEQAQLEVQQQYYQYTLEYLRNNENVTDVVAPSSVGIKDPLLDNLLEDLAEMSQEKVEKAYSSGKNNPVLRVLENKISNTKAALIENINNLTNSNRIAVQENQRRINRLETQLNSLPKSERNLINIERKFALNDNIYNYLLEKRAEAGIAIASNLPDKSVIDKARSNGDGPVEPDIKTVLFMALLVGLGLPTGLIWGQHFFKNKVTDKSDLEKVSQVPMLGVIPRSPKKHKLPVAQIPESAIAESFHFLRIALDQQWLKQHQGARVIGITSSKAGEGKTFCAANLATAYARSRKKTLLIGADIRNPSLHSYFNNKDFGLTTYLEGGIELDAALQATSLPYLTLLNSGQTKADIVWLLENERLSHLFTEALKRYEIIIVDTPPVGLVADFYTMSKLFHQHLFVVRYGVTDTQMLKGVLKRLTIINNQASMILNDAEGHVVEDYGYQSSNNGYYTRVKAKH